MNLTAKHGSFDFLMAVRCEMTKVQEVGQRRDASSSDKVITVVSGSQQSVSLKKSS